MFWILVGLFGGLISFLSSNKRDTRSKVTDALGALIFVGLFASVFGSLIVSTGWAGEQRTITKIITPVERSVVNNEPVLTFTTADNKMWAVPSDTESVVGYANSLVTHEITDPRWFWSFFPAAKADYKTLLIAP